MPQSRAPRALPALLLALGFCTLLGAGDALAQRQGGEHGGQARGEQQRSDRAQPQRSARDAAAIAQARHGGKVLKVTRQGNGYRVRLLQDDGRVITVTVGD
jgi:uncharacterized membrane protein YkoI